MFPHSVQTVSKTLYEYSTIYLISLLLSIYVVSYVSFTQIMLQLGILSWASLSSFHVVSLGENPPRKLLEKLSITIFIRHWQVSFVDLLQFLLRREMVLCLYVHA